MMGGSPDAMAGHERHGGHDHHEDHVQHGSHTDHTGHEAPADDRPRGG
jgi:hypothetical protein